MKKKIGEMKTQKKISKTLKIGKEKVREKMKNKKMKKNWGTEKLKRNFQKI